MFGRIFKKSPRKEKVYHTDDLVFAVALQPEYLRKIYGCAFFLGCAVGIVISVCCWIADPSSMSFLTDILGFAFVGLMCGVCFVFAIWLEAKTQPTDILFWEDLVVRQWPGIWLIFSPDDPLVIEEQATRWVLRGVDVRTNKRRSMRIRKKAYSALELLFRKIKNGEIELNCRFEGAEE